MYGAVDDVFIRKRCENSIIAMKDSAVMGDDDDEIVPMLLVGKHDKTQEY